VASLVLAHRRRKFFERTLEFLHSCRRNNFCFFWGSKWCDIYISFTQPTADKNKFWGCFLGQKGPIYTHFLHSAAQAKKFGFFRGQNAAIYTHFGVFWGQNATIYTHFWGIFWEVKMLPYNNVRSKRGKTFFPRHSCHCMIFHYFG
jgi:hypothetical protein